MKRASHTPAIVLSSVSLLGLGTFAAPAEADDLFVAGTIGEVYVGDSVNGGFEQWGLACLGPIQALAMDDSNLYAGDLSGGIIRFDLAAGEGVDLFFAPDSITAMVMHDGDLLVSEADGEIHRMDPIAGAVESTLTGPYGIEAMLLLDGDLYVSSALEGSVWKGDPVSGNFQYFGCGCSGPAVGLAADDTSLYATDTFGLFVRYDLATGALLDEGVLPFSSSAMVADGPDMLISESNGTIHRLDPLTRVELDSLTSPVAVEAMLMGHAPIAADLNDDGVVDVVDLLAALAAWGSCQSPCPPGCTGDINGDCRVDVVDLLEILASWG